MKVSDHTMTILTGLVLTVTVGMLAQNSEAIISGLAGENILKVQDDAYTVRAGKPQLLNVMLNDQAPNGHDSDPIVIVDKPSCGAVSLEQGQIEYRDSQSCRNEVTFTYCLAADENCVLARVALQVLPQVTSGPVVASADEAEIARTTEDAVPTDIVSANPDLATPDPVDDLDPQVATATIQTLGSTAQTDPAEITDVAELALVTGIETGADVRGVGPSRLGTSITPLLPLAPVAAAIDAVPVQTAAVSGDSLIDRAISVAAPPIEASVVASAANPVVPAISEPQFEAQAMTVALAEVAAPTQPAIVEPARVCPVDVSATAAVGAEIALTLSAPCQPESAILVRQGEFEFSAVTDAAGTFSGTFPALANQAQVAIILADGIEKSLTVAVPEADRFTRVALLWKGEVDLDLHAGQFGAKPGQPGYVWAGEPGSYRQARQTGGGYLQSFGSGSTFAEIYTWPLSKRQGSGVVDLSLHVADGSKMCDQSVDLRVLRYSAGTSDASNVRFTLGACSDTMIGYEIVNALGDLRVAAR